MHLDKPIVRVLAAVLLWAGVQVFAQQPGHMSTVGGPAQGELRVAATVVSSVGLIFDQNGERQIVTANAVDPRDNVSRLQEVVVANLNPPTPKDKASRSAKAKKH